jgi:HSP20 family protein
MTEIAVRRGRKNEGGQMIPAGQMADFEPFRMIRNMMRWDPFREMAPIWSGDAESMFVPAFEVKENKDGFVFKADLPGVKDENLDVTVAGNRLNVSGKREAEREDQGETYFTYERTYGSFTRSFTLPEDVDADKVHADLKEGVLTLVVPKKPEMQPKKINVKS